MNRKPLSASPLVGFLALILLGGCTSADQVDQDRSSTLTILYGPGDHRVLTPLGGLPDMHLVYSSLFEPPQDGEPVPGLVRAWEHTEDFREWTYHLRPDVRWHDGAPFTAHDVRFTYDLYGHPAVAMWSPEAQTITVLDDSTFTVLRHTRHGLAMDDWTVILPRHLLKDLDPERFSEWEEWTHPIGTGPYRFVRYEPRTGIEVEANPDYFLGKPRIDRIILKLGGTAWADLESGTADIDQSAEPATLFRLARDPRFKTYWRAARKIGVMWNHGNPLFQDVRVRKALTHSIDRRAMAVALNYPPDFPLVDFPATVEQMNMGDFPEPYPYDPDLARDLLEDAGWQDQDGDGVLERAGEEFRFRLLADGSSEPMAVLLKDQFHRTGIEVEIDLTANPVVRDRLRAGDFDGIVGRIDIEVLLTGSDDLPGAGYQNVELERILAERDASFDPQADEDANRAMWPILRREHPVTPLIPRPRYTIAHVRVKGLRSPDRVWPGFWAAHLWIEEEGG